MDEGDVSGRARAHRSHLDHGGAALESLDRPVAITDEAGHVVFWNGGAQHLTGHAAAEVLGQRLDDFMWPAEGTDIGDSTGPASFSPILTDWIIRTRQGDELPVRASVDSVHLVDGQPGRLVQVLRPQSASGSFQPRHLLASIADTSRESILSVGVEGTVRWASPATVHILGWRPEEIVGEQISVIAPAELQANQHATCQRVLDGETVRSSDVTRVRRDGSTFDAAVALGAVRDDAGKVIGVTWIIREVTAPERSQREPVRVGDHSLARFEQVSVPQALIGLDARFVSVNRPWCDLFGYGQEDLVGRHITALIHANDVDQALEDLAPLRQGEIESASYELLGRHADGRRLSLLLDATVLREPDGSPYAIAAFARDVTEVKEARRRLAAQENLYRALSRRSSDAAIVTDTEFNLIYVSPSVTELFGYQREQMVAVLGWDFVHPDDVDRVREQVDAVLAEPEHTERFTLRIRAANGEWRWVEETLTNCLMDPDIGGLVANLRDVTAEVEAQRAMHESEARYRAIVETAQEGILVTVPGGGVLFANEMMAQLLGTTLRQVYESDVCDALTAHSVHPRESTTGKEDQQRAEMVYDHPDGTQRVLSLTSSPLSAETGEVGTLTMVSDVTAARHAESELRRKALHDPLTELPNRYLLGDRLRMAAARQQRTDGLGMAVMFLDLDGFKVVNDSQGHEVGDRLLQEVAARLAGSVRAADTVARLGGDEFAVICEEADAPAATAVADRIHHALRDPINVEDLSFEISASIGVALSPPLDSNELLRRADVAMYRAKDAGGAVTVVFDGG